MESEFIDKRPLSGKPLKKFKPAKKIGDTKEQREKWEAEQKKIKEDIEKRTLRSKEDIKAGKQMVLR